MIMLTSPIDSAPNYSNGLRKACLTRAILIFEVASILIPVLV
jgi:hypothetical protein